MVALSSYFDESFDSRGFTVAGYLGSVEGWDHVFTPAWQKVLKDAPHKLTEFKAGDSRSFRNQFCGWSISERDALTAELVSVIVEKSEAFGFASVLLYPGEVTPGRQETKRERKLVAKAGYSAGTFACLYDTLRYGKELLRVDADQIQPVFDKIDGFEHVLLAQFAKVEKLIGPEYWKGVGSPIITHKPLAPLQAADLLAYETYKEARNRREGRVPSMALRRLFRGRPHFARCVFFENPQKLMLHKATGGAIPDDLSVGLLYTPGGPLRGKGNWGVPL